MLSTIAIILIGISPTAAFVIGCLCAWARADESYQQPYSDFQSEKNIGDPS
jgi:hypothetical protein